MGRALPDKLTGHQLVTKFTAFYGTTRFITAFTNAPQLTYPHTDQSKNAASQFWEPLFILLYHLSLGFASGPFLSGFPIRTL